MTVKVADKLIMIIKELWMQWIELKHLYKYISHIIETRVRRILQKKMCKEFPRKALIWPLLLVVDLFRSLSGQQAFKEIYKNN